MNNWQHADGGPLLVHGWATHQQTLSRFINQFDRTVKKRPLCLLQEAEQRAWRTRWFTGMCITGEVV